MLDFEKAIKSDIFNLDLRYGYRIDTGDLKIFEAVARLGGMNRAAGCAEHRAVKRYCAH
jgi:hypothetical protein